MEYYSRRSPMSTQPRSMDPNHDATALADAQEIVELANRRDIACRRLRLSLSDLGLLRLVGADWIDADDDHVTFGALDLEQAFRLIGRLKEIASGRPDPVGLPGPGQLGLDFEPQPVPVSPAIVSGGLHLGGGR
jgi:hypothetical protein